MNIISVEKENFRGLDTIEKIHLLLTCFIISWFNNGIVVQLFGARSVSLFAAYGLWFLISCYFNKYFVWEYVKKAKWLLLFSIIVLISSLQLTAFWNKQSYAALYIPIIYSIGVFFTGEKYTAHKKFILKYFLIECIIICLKSIYVLNTNTMYSRAMAGGMEVDTTYSLVISYTSVYAFTALAIFLLNIRRNWAKTHKPLIILFIIMATIAIYMANYATAIFLGLAFVVFSLISKKKWSLVVFILLCILAYILFKPYLAKMFLWISELNISEHLQSKAYSLAMTMQGRKVDFNSFETRIEFMQNSFSVFTKAPIFGIYGRTELMIKYGYLLRDHNVWVDMLAYYGILRTLPIVIFYITWYKNTVKNKDYSYSYAVFCVSMFCILCGFFNPINKSVVQLVMFIIIPISDVLVNSDKKTNKNLLNDKYKIKILREE